MKIPIFILLISFTFSYETVIVRRGDDCFATAKNIDVNVVPSFGGISFPSNVFEESKCKNIIISSVFDSVSYYYEGFVHANEIYSFTNEISSFAFVDSSAQKYVFYDYVTFGEYVFAGKMNDEKTKCKSAKEIETVITCDESHSLGDSSTTLSCAEITNIYLPDENVDEMYENTNYHSNSQMCQEISVTTSGNDLIVSGYGTVTEQHTQQFKNQNFNTIEIKNGISAIGSNAFSDINCQNVKLPFTLRSIGTNAFQNNQHLQSLDIPPMMRYFNLSSISNCPSIQSITIQFVEENFKIYGESSIPTISNLRTINFCGIAISVIYSIYEDNNIQINVRKSSLNEDFFPRMSDESICLKQLSIEYPSCKFNWVGLIVGAILPTLITFVIILGFYLIPPIVRKSNVTNKKRLVIILYSILYGILSLMIFIAPTVSFGLDISNLLKSEEDKTEIILKSICFAMSMIVQIVSWILWTARFYDIEKIQDLVEEFLGSYFFIILSFMIILFGLRFGLKFLEYDPDTMFDSFSNFLCTFVGDNVNPFQIDLEKVVEEVKGTAENTTQVYQFYLFILTIIDLIRKIRDKKCETCCVGFCEKLEKTKLIDIEME